MARYILAIDLGTSGPKVAYVDPSGRILASEIEETGVDFLPNGGAEQDPDVWWSAICKAAQRLKSNSGKSVDIAGICVTAQWSGTVAVDREGKHLAPAIIWMDSRGAEHIKKVTDGIINVEGYGLTKILKLIRITGGAPGHSGKDPIAHILFIKNTNPELYKKTYKFLEAKDYINGRLTGKLAAGFDSIALHWVTDNRNINKINYHPGLLSMMGVERDKLPDLLRAVDILGPVTKSAAEQLGVAENTPVVMGSPDIHSAAIGSGAVKDYQSHLYIGTSSWLTCHVPFKKTDILHNMATLPSAIPGRYFIGNEQETAGYCLTYLRDKIFYAQDELQTGPVPADAYARFNAAAATIAPGSDGLIFTPWLYGERTPIEDHSVRGAFFNQSLRTTRSHMIRAAMEGVAYNSRWLLDCVRGFTKQKILSINFIGGGARSPIWCQIIADVLDCQIRQVEDPVQANTRGAGLLGAVALGLTTFENISSDIPIAKIYDPIPENRITYANLFTEFKNIYKANKKIYARLNH